MALFASGVIYAGGIFILQRILFARTSRKGLHCIPLYLIGFVYLFAIGCFLYDTLGFSVHDGFLFYTLMAWILLGINTIALLADGIAWLIEKV